jgi:hypothetical protein
MWSDDARTVTRGSIGPDLFEGYRDRVSRFRPLYEERSGLRVPGRCDLRAGPIAST